MLEHIRHRQLAKKLFRPWGESRFLWFAKKDDSSGGGGIEGSSEKGPRKGPEESIVDSNIASIRNTMRLNSSATRLHAERIELIKKISVFPPAIEAALGSTTLFSIEDAQSLSAFVEKEDGESDEAFAVRKSYPERIAKTLRENSAAKERFDAILEDRLRSPENIVVLAGILESRSAKYRELTEQIEHAVGLNLGAVTIDKLSQLDAELQTWADEMAQQHGGERPHVYNLETWLSDKSTVEIAEKLGIDPVAKAPEIDDVLPKGSDDPEIRRAIESVAKRRFTIVRANDEEEEETEKEEIIRRVRNAQHRERTRQHLHVHDTGDDSEESTYQSGTLEALDASILQLKNHLDEHLQVQARDLAKFYLGSSQKLVDKYGSLEAAAEELGYSSEEYDYQVAQELTALSTVTREADEDEETENLIRPEADTENLYLSQAKNRLHQMQRMQDFKDTHDAIEQEHGEDAAQEYYEDEFVGELQDSEIETVEWAERNLERLRDAAATIEENDEAKELIRELFGTHVGTPSDSVDIQDFIEGFPQIVDDITRILAGEEPVEGGMNKHAFVAFLDTAKQEKIEMLLDLLEEPEQLGEIHELIASYNNVDTASTDVEQLHESVGNVKENLLTRCSALDNPAAVRLGAKEMLGDVCRGMEKRLAALMDPERKADVSHRDITIREITVEVKRLNNAYEELARLDKNHPQTRIVIETSDQIHKGQGDDNATAGYSLRTGNVCLQENTSEQEEQHEIGHAVIDTLVRRTGVLPKLLVDIGTLMQEPSDSGNDNSPSWMALLMQLKSRWGYEETHKRLIRNYEAKGKSKEIAERLAEKNIRDMMIEELIMKHIDWKANSENGVDVNAKYNDAERSLFAWVEGEQPTILRMEGTPERGQALEEIRAANVDLTNDDIDQTSAANAPTPEPTASIRDYNQEMREIERDVTNYRAFIKAYPEYKAEIEWYVDEIEQAYTIYIKEPYQSGNISTDVLGEKIDLLRSKHIAEVNDFIKQVDNNKMDLRNAPGSGMGLAGLLRNVRWVSVMDIVNTFKQAGEDIGRMWKRRGESAQASLGKFLTGWIPDNKIYGLEYLGRLKKEFNRRDKASEIEEVKQWKEALDDADSFELQDLLRTTRNRDQIRAIIELLSEGGRLDWNDRGFMKTLSAMSHYDMPIDACLRDDVLRDKWFNLILADIWGDKEHYYNWRRQNDGAITSKKKEFTSTADQLSNVSGGLNGELERILRLYVETTEAGNPMPQDVNPHLYEEIIDYSIRNGKMTMEDKFFYLVQGIRHGLLSIDRLRTLAGEEGGILNIFPFIDYFYGKNNSLADITALGKRLDEGSKGSAKRFTSGLKTTMFVRMEVSREQRVQERLKKGVGKQGENIDHDDIPYFLPELDQSGIKEWLSTLSGNRQKLSKEALKNGYVGFSMKFKTFAALAEMDRQGLKKFSKADARNLAQTIGSYVLFDNILSRNAFDNFMQRPELSAFEYDQPTVMGAGGTKVRDYRLGKGNATGLNSFVGGILGDFMTQADWTALDTTQEEFFDVLPGKNIGNDGRAKELFYKSDAFVSRLENAILADPSTFINRLLNTNFLSDGVIGDAFNNDDIIKVQKQWAARGEAAA